jgi:hypothetical protein
VISLTVDRMDRCWDPHAAAFSDGYAGNKCFGRRVVYPRHGILNSALSQAHVPRTDGILGHSDANNFISRHHDYIIRYKHVHIKMCCVVLISVRQRSSGPPPLCP